jgi:hypothetical protein
MVNVIPFLLVRLIAPLYPLLRVSIDFSVVYLPPSLGSILAVGSKGNI